MNSLAAQSHGFLSPTGVEIAFLLVGVVTFGAAVVTVTTRRLVHAALWLVVALGGLAVEYLLLTAEFIAWVQVLIYLGSVVVLLLFGLMLTRAPIGPSPDADSENRPVAVLVAVSAAAALIWVVVDAFRTTYVDLDGAPLGTTEVTGASLFRGWVLPFEALSVLLLAALVGAIVVSRRNAAGSDAGSGDTGTRGPAADRGPAASTGAASTDPASTDAAPVDEAPADAASTDAASADEAPADEAPADEVPVDEAPTADAPADDAPEKEQR